MKLTCLRISIKNNANTLWLLHSMSFLSCKESYSKYKPVSFLPVGLSARCPVTLVTVIKLWRVLVINKIRMSDTCVPLHLIWSLRRYETGIDMKGLPGRSKLHNYIIVVTYHWYICWPRNKKNWMNNLMRKKPVMLTWLGPSPNNTSGHKMYIGQFFSGHSIVMSSNIFL